MSHERTSSYTLRASADRGDARLAQRLAERRTFQALTRDVRAAHRARGSMQAQQFRALRVGMVRKSGAAAFVGLAHQRQLRDAFGLAEAVAAREQIVHGLVAQFRQAMHVEMFAAGHDREFAMRGRDFQALAQCAQRRDAALFVLDVSGQLLDRRERLAEVMGRVRRSR